MRRISLVYSILIGVFMSLLSGCSDSSAKDNKPTDVPPAVTDYQRILESGKLVVLLENSTNSYFIYRGQKMGYEYEILQEFAKDLGVELEVKTVANMDNIFDLLDNREGDVVGCNLTVTLDRQKQIDFSIPFIQSPQVIIQRKAEGGKESESKSEFITEPYQLAQKEVHVWENSSYYQRIQYLQNEIGDTIYVDAVNGLIGAEELIERVSQGIIDYTVVEEDVARINARFYNNIDFSTQISVKQNIAFGLRKESTLLKAKLDKWLASFLKSKKHQYIYRKYFEIGVTGHKEEEPVLKLKKGQISPYDELFKAVAKNSEVSWHLLAAIAHHESRFNPNAEGFGGAYGMMQFMPNTGPKYGVYPDSPANVQIAGGMKKLNADLKYWHFIPDINQRIKFALASYNAGRGHVVDAHNLSKKHGLNANVWDGNVEKMMTNLSKQEYYRDEVVKSGSIRGTMTVKYVQSVFQKFQEWSDAHK